MQKRENKSIDLKQKKCERNTKSTYKKTLLNLCIVLLSTISVDLIEKKKNEKKITGQ